MRHGWPLAAATGAGLMLAGLLALAREGQAQEDGTTHRLASPDGRIEVAVHVDQRLEYSISVDRRELVAPSLFELVLDDGTIVGRSSDGAGSAGR